MTPRATQDSPIRWGEPPRGGSLGGAIGAIVARVRSMLGAPPSPPTQALPALPLALRRGDIAQRYLVAEGAADHPGAAATASAAAVAAMEQRAWWPADVWGHRALWHYEQAGMELEATRAARRIGDVRVGGGDPASARRYYAEAISEARDIGAEREEGLAALGMGRAELELRNVTTARRLGQIALDLLERCGAPAEEAAAARELRGDEKEVG